MNRTAFGVANVMLVRFRLLLGFASLLWFFVIYSYTVCGAPKRRFREYTPAVTKNANQTDVRKARKAELQRDEAIGEALPIGIAVGVVALVGLYSYLNSTF